MFKYWLLGLFTGFVLGLLAGVVSTSARADTIPEMRQSVVEVSLPGGLGTGVAIAPDTILTAQHVVDGSKTASIRFFNMDVEITGMVKQEWKDLDLALIHVPFPKSGRISVVNCKLPFLGDSITTIGFPLGLEWVFSKGYVASDIMGDDKMLADMTTNHGNSGGPVFNEKGQVIGIVLAMYSQRPSAEEGVGTPIGVFIPASSFCKPLNIQGIN